MMAGVCLSARNYLEVKRSPVKVARPINAVTDNAPYASWGHWNVLKISLFQHIFQTTHGVHGQGTTRHCAPSLPSDDERKTGSYEEISKNRLILQTGVMHTNSTGASRWSIICVWRICVEVELERVSSARQ